MLRPNRLHHLHDRSKESAVASLHFGMPVSRARVSSRAQGSIATAAETTGALCGSCSVTRPAMSTYRGKDAQAVDDLLRWARPANFSLRQSCSQVLATARGQPDPAPTRAPPLAPPRPRSANSSAASAFSRSLAYVRCHMPFGRLGNGRDNPGSPPSRPPILLAPRTGPSSALFLSPG